MSLQNHGNSSLQFQSRSASGSTCVFAASTLASFVEVVISVFAINRAPQIADLGEEGRESWLELELKLVADVGIIGVPNAGKSTLLSVITAGQPLVAM